MRETDPLAPWNPRPSDCPFYRIRIYAEQRARANGVSEDGAALAGRIAVALRRKLLEEFPGIDPSVERIISTVAGEHRKRITDAA